MQKFTTHKGIACPLEYANIDTDQIIPKQFLLAVSKQGFGKHLFHDLRYLDDKESVLNMDFNLNKKEYQNSSILVSFEKFWKRFFKGARTLGFGGLWYKSYYRAFFCRYF